MSALSLRVLGSAAGGGLPQWNCACEPCALARAGDPRVRRRTQDSIAVTADREHFVLLNASPDVLRQIEATPALTPRDRRGTPIAAVVLCNGDVDHVAGLLSLRESQPLVVAATERVFVDLFERNVVFRTLQRFLGQLTWVRLEIGVPVSLAGVEIVPFAAPGKSPAHLPNAKRSPEENVGLVLDRRVVYAPSVGALDTVVRDTIGRAEVLLFDGTFWSSDELARRGVGATRAEAMAHVPVVESLEVLGALPAKRKVLVHLNNTNPLVVEGSPERIAAERAGLEIAWDGLEIEA